MNTLANSAGGVGGTIGGVLGVIGLIAAYWVPAIVAAARKVPNVGTVVVVNLFLGWTVIGWIVALAMAMRDPAPQPPVVSR
jgi:hypothetical protein